MTRRRVFLFIFIVVFLLLLFQLGLILAPFFTPILWALILAQLAYPLYLRVLDKVHGRCSIAAGLLTALITAIAVLPAMYVILLGAQEGVDAYERVAQWVKAGGLHEIGVTFSRLPGIGRIGQEVIGRMIVANGEVETSILAGSKAVSALIVTQGAELIKDAVVFVTDFFMMLFTLFFLFRDGDRLYARVYRAIPLEDEHKTKITDRLGTTVTAVVRGNLLTALAQGVVSGLAYWLLDVPFPVFLGALSGLLSLLPFGGTGFVWGPVALYLLGTGDVVKGLIMLAVGLGLVGVMDNILAPYLIGTRAKLPMLFLFFASLGGMAYFGFLGLFLGPIILAVVMEAFEIYEEEFNALPHNGHGLIQEVPHREPNVVSGPP